MYTSVSQYYSPLDMSEVTWNNKQGWSIPRDNIDNSALVFVSCVATLGGKEYQSNNYLIHSTGKKHNAMRK